MTSLSEVYGGTPGEGDDLRRLYLGVGLFLAGAVLTVAGMVTATTDLVFGSELVRSRHVGGLLAGVGVPAVFLGISTVLPANRRTRAASVMGASIALLGVAMFWQAYPCQWSGSNCGAGLVDLTLPTVGVYFLGMLTTTWSLFVGIANFKTRNDPGGTVKMEVTRQGETRVIEVERSKLDGLGGVGLLGSTPDGDVETQTNQPESGGRPGATASARSNGGTTRSRSGDGSEVLRSPTPAQSDGGATERTVREPKGSGNFQPTDDAEFLSNEPESSPGPGDTYCGNCRHFEYVRTDKGIQPYCTFHKELMDDMDACEQWEPRKLD